MNRKINFKTKKFDEVIDLDFLRRLFALIRKEFLQLVRDNSSILIGAVLPIVLILLIGYGISLDVKNVPIAVVLEDSSPTARHSINFLSGSEYFSPYYVTTIKKAREMMDDRKIDTILVIPPDFTANLYDRTAKIQLILYGVNNTTATSIQDYVKGKIRKINSCKIAVESRKTFKIKKFLNNEDAKCNYYG